MMCPHVCGHLLLTWRLTTYCLPQACDALVSLLRTTTCYIRYVTPPRSLLNAARLLGCRLRFCDSVY